MSEVTGINPLRHAEALELLPWLANDTLRSAQRHRVEAHVRDCVTCRREFRFLRQVARGVSETDPARLGLQRDFDSLMARIDRHGHDPSRTRQWWAGLRARLSSWSAAGALPVGPRLRLALSVQALIIIGLLVVLFGAGPAPMSPADGAFQTLSEPAGGAGTARLWVGFAPEATVQEVAALLRTRGARVVRGPLADGVFLLQVPGADAGDLSVWRDAGEVIYAEWADPGERVHD